MSHDVYDANDLALLIRDNSDLTGSEIKEKVNDLVDKYDPFVNKEAACFLLAREVGVDLTRHLNLQQDLSLDVENIVEDMNSVDIEFKVERVLGVNEFDGGKVRNIKVSDGTGSTHLVVWGSDVEAFEEVSRGDVLRVRNGYSKYSDYNGQVEVHVGDDGVVLDADTGEELV
jgi:hypothetical protein